jgi:hypothetical protein
MVDVLGSVACSTLLVRKGYFVAKFPVQVAKITDNLTFTHQIVFFKKKLRAHPPKHARPPSCLVESDNRKQRLTTTIVVH